MELQFENLVGRRESKGELEAVVIAEVTKGNFRISPAVSAKLGISDNSFVTLQKNGDTIYIGKGKDGVIKTDENGNYVLDHRGHRQYEEEGFGAAAREIAPGSGLIKVSNTFAWQAIGGSTDEKKVFELGEGVDVVLPTDKGTFATVLYPLVFVRSEEKLMRDSKKEKTSTVEPVQAEPAADDFASEDL